MYSPLAIANTIIEKKPGLTLLQLNKLVYLVQGWSLALRSPIVSELPIAFAYGPDYVSLYPLRRFGTQPIRAVELLVGLDTPLTVPSRDVEAHRVIDAVVKQYGSYLHWQLSALTHADGTPWAELVATDKRAVANHVALSEAAIRDYFIRLVASAPVRKAA